MSARLIATTLLAALLWPLQFPEQTTTPADPLVREEQTVLVRGVSETWRLVWQSPPKPFCDTEEPNDAISCPCQGFAYGETGALDLVRLVQGREVDRLPLAPLFARTLVDQEGAAIPRWPTRESDIEKYDRPEFPAEVRKRSLATIMTFADYNHDGQATEFYLQTDVAPCGKSIGTVIGVTAKRPRLHAFGSAKGPNSPLHMQRIIWNALLKSAHATIVSWPCGDHGAEWLSEVEVRVKAQGIEAIRRDYECLPNDKRGRLTGTTVLTGRGSL